MPAIPVMTDGEFLIGKTGFSPVPAEPTDTPSLDWTPGAGTQAAEHAITENDAVTAAGTTQGAATELDIDSYYLFTVIAASAGNIAIKLKATTKRRERFILNATAFTLSLFPESGGTINFGAANAKVDLAAGTFATCDCRANGLWIVAISQAP